MQAARGAAAFHLGHGTTTALASLVSSPYELMRSAIAGFAPLVAEGVIAGVHFEGPYLSAVRCGAQNPAYLRDPSIEELTALITLGEGAVRMVTIAPELPGALDAIRQLVSHAAIAAIGHTDATYDETRAGVAAGATVGTHLFNAMRPLNHREPGVIRASRRDAVFELVVDNVHLHPALVFAAPGGPGRVALITDAMVAAGMRDGDYVLGSLAVRVRDGVARLAEGDSIAGSTLTMDAALRQAVGAGIDLVDAARMAATTPAAAIGLTDRGALAPGQRADLVVLTEDLRVTRVMRAGTWL